MLKIYNSLTQKKEIFKPISPNKISLYVCGVTVYDYCHIGHARTYAAFDSIIRYLQWRGYDVMHIRNITDIDDKIIKRAQENNEDFSSVVNRNTKAMYEDFSLLGLLAPTFEPRATEYIPQIIAMIQELLAKGYAYIAENGDVYYEVRRFKEYGKLAHRNIDQLESGIRVEVSEVKRDPLDFVLWKLAKPGEPTWESPWGPGRPGWHIECSAMSTALLGKHFDIHGGGKDLIFPHHENEIAQAQAADSCEFANVWMHTGYLQINKEKMSKSLGNFFTIRDVLATHSPEVLRYFFTASHYRSPLSYSEEALHQAHSSLERFYTALRDLPAADPVVDSEFEKRFVDAMDDDFNTPIALSVLFELTHHIQKLRNDDMKSAAAHGALLKRLASVFNILQLSPLDFLHTGKENIDANKVQALIEARNQARAVKDWAQADRVRDELAAMSVILEDGPGGTTWKVLTKP